MRYLTLNEVLRLYQDIIQQSGGTPGIRDLDALESALAQPRQTFAGDDLYPSLVEKAATLGYLLIQNHPFVDGNKRLGHAARFPHRRAAPKGSSSTSVTACTQAGRKA